MNKQNKQFEECQRNYIPSFFDGFKLDFLKNDDLKQLYCLF